MLEELRNDRALELDGVFDDKGFTVVAPAGDAGIARVDHVVRFCSWDGRMERESKRERDTEETGAC